MCLNLYGLIDDSSNVSLDFPYVTLACEDVRWRKFVKTEDQDLTEGEGLRKTSVWIGMRKRMSYQLLGE